MSSTFSSWTRERSANGYAPRTRSCSSPDLDLLVGADRDDLLREHVERVARDHRLLDLAREHPLGDDGRLEQVGAELREDPALRDGAELVAGAADPLQAARDRLRRLDLDHEVDGAHVDPELERRGRDEAGDLAALEQLLDLDALLAGERAVVGARDLLLRQLVQAQRQPLGEAAVVDEDDRRAVLLDEPQELRVDRRPDRVSTRSAPAPHLGCRRARRIGRLRAGARLAHVLDRHDDPQVELLARAGVDEPDRPRPGDEAADLLERALRRGEADRAGPARRRSRSSRSTESARCAPRFVPATACTSSRISVSTLAQHLPRPAR